MQNHRNVLLPPWLRWKTQVNTCQDVASVLPMHVMTPLRLLQHAMIRALQRTIRGRLNAHGKCVTAASNVLVSVCFLRVLCIKLTATPCWVSFFLSSHVFYFNILIRSLNRDAYRLTETCDHSHNHGKNSRSVLVKVLCVSCLCT